MTIGFLAARICYYVCRQVVCDVHQLQPMQMYFSYIFMQHGWAFNISLSCCRCNFNKDVDIGFFPILGHSLSKPRKNGSRLTPYLRYWSSGTYSFIIGDLLLNSFISYGLCMLSNHRTLYQSMHHSSISLCLILKYSDDYWPIKAWISAGHWHNQNLNIIGYNLQSYMQDIKNFQSLWFTLSGFYFHGKTYQLNEYIYIHIGIRIDSGIHSKSHSAKK